VGSEARRSQGYITAAVVPGRRRPLSARPGRPATLNVTFTDSRRGTSPITSRLWNFGDGSSPPHEPSHTTRFPENNRGALGSTPWTARGQRDKAAYIQVSSSAPSDGGVLGYPVKGGPPPINVHFTTPRSRDLADHGALWDFATAARHGTTRPFFHPGDLHFDLGVMTADGSTRESRPLRRRVSAPARLSRHADTGSRAGVPVHDGSTPSASRAGSGTSATGPPAWSRIRLHTFDVRGRIP